MNFYGFFNMKMALKQCDFMELIFLYVCIVLTDVNKTEFSEKPGACPSEGVLPVWWALEERNIFAA